MKKYLKPVLRLLCLLFAVTLAGCGTVREDPPISVETAAQTDALAATTAETPIEPEPLSGTESEPETEPEPDLPEPYRYPMETLEPVAGTIVTDTNVYKVVNGYQGAVIDLREVREKNPESDFRSVTVAKRPGAATFGYAFLADALTEGISPSYAWGYTRVVYTGESERTLEIPENARYLYLYHHSNDLYFLPESVTFSGAASEPTGHSFRVATWNIGHFSGGKKSYSLVPEQNYATVGPQYRDYIERVLNADLIGLNEYSKNFTLNHTAKDAMFSSYPVAFEGEQKHYSCNAVYSRLELRNIEQHAYECNKTATITHTTAIEASDYYYITADLTFEGKDIKLVFTHLGFDRNKTPDTVNQAQILELVALFKDCERVVMMGDWNIRSFDYFQIFRDAGFSLANNDSKLGTFAGSVSALDNVVYKGVTASGFTLAGTTLSDHYAVTCLITVE